MSGESVWQVACSWLDVGSFHTRLLGVVHFCIASLGEFLGKLSYHARLSQTLVLWPAVHVSRQTAVELAD
jgi:hypothetical protein